MTRASRLVLLAVVAALMGSGQASAVPCGSGHPYCKQHYHRHHRPHSPAYYNAPHVP